VEDVELNSLLHEMPVVKEHFKLMETILGGEGEPVG
jgi:hypothetical protein